MESSNNDHSKYKHIIIEVPASLVIVIVKLFSVSSVGLRDNVKSRVEEQIEATLGLNYSTIARLI